MSAPRIALVGTGKMGAAVRQLAGERGWAVVAEVDGAANRDGGGITRESLGTADVVIEFTRPDAAAANAIACARAGVPVVVGTTGWHAERAAVEQGVREADGAMFTAANFSLGVNVFWRVAERMASMLATLPDFAPHVLETHHAAKRDAPSGTAVELRDRAARALGRDVPVTSVRVGWVPGTHELLFDGPYEQLRLEHVARDRRAFAEGALLAAAWLTRAWHAGRRGAFTMDDLLDDPTATRTASDR